MTPLIICRHAVTLAALVWSSIAFGGEIHDAARDCDLGQVKALLKAYPNLVFSKDDDGNTPLYWAVGTGHKDVPVLLLANKADVNAKNNRGDTPLLWAGDGDVARLLLARKANVNAKSDNG
jgi:ankyrin repeat protein